MKRKYNKPLIWIVILVLVIGYLFYGNLWIVDRYYQITTPKLSVGKTVKIASLSDFHDRFLDSKRLFSQLAAFNPDIIVITGDITIYGQYNADTVAAFAQRISKIAPTYFVSGNHDCIPTILPGLESLLNENGIHVLSNANTTCDGITIAGMEDINWFYYKDNADKAKAAFQKTLDQIVPPASAGGFTLLLSHRPDPDLVDFYQQSGADLTICGHTHGGIIRIPFLGGVFSKGKLFPKYDGGFFSLGDGQNLIVNRGLGNGRTPPRVFDNPEICFITVTGVA